MSVWFSKAEGPCQVRRGHCPTAHLPSPPSSQHQHQIPAQSFTLGCNLSPESLEKTKKIPATLPLRNVNNSKSGLIFHSACFAGLFAHHVSFFPLHSVSTFSLFLTGFNPFFSPSVVVHLGGGSPRLASSQAPGSFNAQISPLSLAHT